MSLVGLLERLGLPDELVLCVYQYGSRYDYSSLFFSH